MKSRVTIPKDVHALRHCLLDGKEPLIVYKEIALPDNPYKECLHYYRQLERMGLLDDTSNTVIEMLDRNGSVIFRFPVAREGIEYIYNQIKLKMAK